MRHYALKFTNYMLSDQVYVDDYLRVIFEFTNTTQEFSYIAPLVNKYILINSEHFSLDLELEVSKLDTSRHYEMIDIKVTKNLLKDIMTIKKSLTWKITHPFRNIPEYLKKMIIAVQNKTEI